MMKIMNILMLSCRKATELIEKKQVFNLSLSEKVQLNLHTSMCNACKSYESQSSTIDKALKHHHNAKSINKSDTIPEELKQKIQDQINNF